MRHASHSTSLRHRLVSYISAYATTSQSALTGCYKFLFYTDDRPINGSISANCAHPLVSSLAISPAPPSPNVKVAATSIAGLLHFYVKRRHRTHQHAPPTFTRRELWYGCNETWFCSASLQIHADAGTYSPSSATTTSTRILIFSSCASLSPQIGILPLI